ncbi:hypothetical protein Mal65_45740 [Crateriforma conspicua]|nr:DUF1501 domain-containing protein [Crateriforma conspicua]QDV65403.1 hypothetical protein Mal65_45740 [Crateriforma conspicua]
MFPKQTMTRLALSRRHLLQRSACGFGAVALSALHQAAEGANRSHHAAKAKHVIFLYMDGGPSQIDTFDPKPRLTRENGQPFGMKMEKTQFDNNGTTLGSPWKFSQHGESGLPISELFPNVAKHADRLCVIRSMTSEFSEHTSANYFLHSGLGQVGRPSMGAWVTYGLGSESDDLPGFVVLNGGLTPPGGLDNFSSGFLPANHQASVFASGPMPVANLVSDDAVDRATRKRHLLGQLDQSLSERWGRPDPVEAAIRNYELAFRMQSAVPELADLSGESQHVRDAYGVDDSFKPKAIYARQCLLARRLIQRGVRFIELTCPSVSGNDRWDQHKRLRKGHEENSLAVDQPIAALLADLDEHGLLDETLVVFAGEFGRTPFAQGDDGRDHNPFGFSIWMAGGGVRGGTVYGATDEYGYHAVENPLMIHDLHAMMLHQLGIDHRRLTFRFGGRDMRLTDVHGTIVPEIVG